MFTCRSSKLVSNHMDDKCPFCRHTGKFNASRLSWKSGFDILKKEYGGLVASFPVHALQSDIEAVEQGKDSRAEGNSRTNIV